MNKRYERDFDSRDWSRGYTGYGATSGSYSGQGSRDYNRETGRDFEWRNDWRNDSRGEYAGEYRSGREGFSERIGERVKRFFGKGPKGYKRSDERIREDVCDRLAEGWIDASDIEVAVKDGEVTLTGTVVERSMKRMAEELSERVSGVEDVHNHLRVKKEYEPGI